MDLMRCLRTRARYSRGNGLAPLVAAVLLLSVAAGTARAVDQFLPPLQVVKPEQAGHSEPATPQGDNAGSIRITKKPGASRVAAMTPAQPPRRSVPSRHHQAASLHIAKSAGSHALVAGQETSGGPAVLRIQDDQQAETQVRPLHTNSLPLLVLDGQPTETAASRPSQPQNVPQEPPQLATYGPAAVSRVRDNAAPTLLDVHRTFNPNRAAPSAPRAPELGAEAIRLLQESSDDGTSSVSQPRQLNEDDRFGQAPADADNRQVFLRTETVLLAPGEHALDFGLRYIWREFEFPVTLLPGPVLAEQRIRSRQLFMPFQLRYGLAERTQMFVDVPVGMSHFETSNIASDFFTSKFGIGDVTAGISYQCQSETDDQPAMILTVSTIAPTGDDPFAPTLI